MKYSYEFKLKVVKYYLKTGTYPNVKIESNRDTFKSKVRVWAALYKKYGAECLKHKKHKRFDINQKLETIKKYKKGYSCRELGILLGIEHTVVSNWIKRYNANGIKGLIDLKKGRPPKNRKKENNSYIIPYNDFKSTIEKVRYISKNKKANKSLKEYLDVYKISRSTYFYNLKRKTYREKNEYLYSIIKDMFELSGGTYGLNRMKMALKNEYGLIINKKKIQRIMKDQNLKVKLQRAKYKSYKGNRGKICADLIKRDFVSNEPLKKITTDVTEFNLPFGKVYLQTYLDMYNEEILCYQISTNPSLCYTERMLNELIRKYKGNINGTIFHSDQGWQYQTKWYQDRITQLGCYQSMSRKGNCLDNAIMENFFGRLKMEMFYGHEYEFKNYNHFKSKLIKYIYYYNNIRIKTKYETSPINYKLNTICV